MENQNPSQVSPIKALVEQTQLLDESIEKLIKQNGLEVVIKDYIVPIIATLTQAVDQNFIAMSNVAQTASVALMTAEKTVAAEILSDVADISNVLVDDFSTLLDAIKDRLSAEELAKAKEIQDLHLELQELVEPWDSLDDLDDDELDDANGEALDEESDEELDEESDEESDDEQQ